MITNRHILSSFRKRLDTIPVNHIKKDIFLVLKEWADGDSPGHGFEQRPSAQLNDDSTPFNDWNMPDQPHGYIKAKKHGLL